MTKAFARKQFPQLATPVRWGPVEAVFVPGQRLPPQSLIGNVNVIPFVGDLCVVLRMADRRPEIPGGTLEPGENYLATLERELTEEAGARLLSFTLLGAWRCHSAATESYRPHLPHPDFYRVVGYGEVDLVGNPTNPAGAEQITAVDLTSVEVASRLFTQWQRPDLAALYLLADYERETSRPRTQ